MPGLPVVSASEFMRTVAKLGYRVDRQQGSHVIMECPGRRPLVVHQHKQLKPGLFRGLVRDAGLSTDGFEALLKGR